MKSFLISFIVLASIGSAAYFYSMSSNPDEQAQLQNEKYSQEIEKLKAENERLLALKKKSELAVQNLEKKVSSLEDLMNKSKELRKSEFAAQEKTSVEPEAEKEVEESPAEKKRKAQMKKFLLKEIEKNYAALFEEMNFSDDIIASVKEKLLERDSEIVSAVFKSILQSLPTEEGQTQEQALAKSILDSIEKANAELALDLGDSFGEFREQEKIGFTLKELSNFEGVLGENTLGEEQRLGLNDLMFEHHNSVLQNVAAGETTFKEADEKLVEKSAEYLNETQQKSLSNFLKMKRGGS